MGNSVVNPLWSISVEEQFYLLWAPVVRRSSSRRIIGYAIIMLVVANLARVASLFFHANHRQIWCDTLTRLDPIAAGILIAVILHGKIPQFGAWTRFVYVCSGVILLVVISAYTRPISDETVASMNILFRFPGATVACVLIMLGVIGIKMTFSPLKILQYLGKISYGLYVYHYLGIWSSDQVFSNRSSIGGAGLRAIVALILTIVMAVLSYLLLEKPFLNLKRRFTYVASRPA